MFYLPKVSARSSSQILILTATLGASVLSSLDLFIVNLAIPRIEEAFADASAQQLSWVLNAYTVTFAALLAPAGRLADHLGRRRVFAAGFIFFTLGSVMAVVSPAIAWLIIARAMQGLGASIIVPTSLALLLDAYPQEQHKRMISLWAATGSIAAALGPVAGGLLADVNWRLVFALKIPLAILALFSIRGLPASTPRSGRMPDLLGALYLAGFIASSITLLTFSAEWGLAEQRSWLIASAGLIALVLFVWRTKNHASPVLDLNLFRIPALTLSVVGMTVFYVGFSVMLLGGSLWATNIWHWDSALTGLCFVLGPGTAVVAAILAGKTDIPAQWLSFAGGILFVIAGVLWSMTLTEADSSPMSFALGLILTGAAAGIAQTGFLAAGAATLPADGYAAGSGVISIGRQIGASLGVALLVVFISTGHVASTFIRGWEIIAVSGAVAALTILPSALKAKPSSAAANK